MLYSIYNINGEYNMRFFHKFYSVNYNFLGLVNGILLRAKRKNKFTKAIDYLKKYEYILDKQEIMETSDKYPNKIWQCWFQGKDNMPAIVKKCTDSVLKYHSDKVILLNNNNISEYIDLPEYIIEKHKKGIIPFAHYSDILRLSLLAKYGGTWVDSTILLTDKIPDEIFNAEIFSFKSLQTYLFPFIKNINDFKIYSNHLDSVISIESSYFLGAKAGNKIINDVLNLLLEYWKHENSVIDYLMLDKFFIITILHDEKLKQQFLNMPTYYIENVLLMQNAQFEPFNQEMYNMITTTTPIHKMTHKNLHRNPYKNSFLNHILNS